MRRGMGKKNRMTSTVIQGVDGPTSVFIAGKGKDSNIIRRLRTEMQRKQYQRRRARAAAGLTADAHSVAEVCIYIRERYHAEEVGASDIHYKEEYRSLKASMIQKYQPELLGEPLPPYDFTDVEAVKNYLEKCEEQVQRAVGIPPEQFPFDFHQYQITIDGCGRLDIVMDFSHDYISYSYSAEKGGRKVMDGIVKDIWLYYGVSKEDIEQESERMQALLTILASMR